MQVHAHVYAALKAGELLQEAPRWLSALLVAFAAGLAWALIVFCRRPILATALLFAGLIAGVGAQLWLFNHASFVWHSSTPLLGYGLIGICGFSYDFLLERRQKLGLKRTISRFHSPDVAEQIVQNPETYFSIRQGAARCIVILFSDVRGYTSMSEQMTAQQMVTQLNEYFERMVASVSAAVLAVDRGAQVVRVHDVKETAQAISVWQAVKAASV